MIDQNNFGNPVFNNVYGGAQPQQVTKFQNTLSEEEINQLMKSGSSFSLAITKDEQLRGICNHRTADGMGDALVVDEATGALRCQICGYTFHQVDPSMTADEIKENIKVVIDMLQTIKLMFIDLPVESSREYFQLIPLLEKLPGLFEIAAKNMAKHETFGWNYQNPNMSAYSMFQNLSNIFGGGMMMGQPAYQQPTQNPGFMGAPQQPMYNPMGVAPQAPYGASNGFGFVGGPGYQPANAGFAYQPGVAPATPTVPQVPVVDAQAKEVPQEKTVQQTVKA